MPNLTNRKQDDRGHEMNDQKQVYYIHVCKQLAELHNTVWYDPLGEGIDDHVKSQALTQAYLELGISLASKAGAPKGLIVEFVSSHFDSDLGPFETKKFYTAKNM